MVVWHLSSLGRAHFNTCKHAGLAAPSAVVGLDNGTRWQWDSMQSGLLTKMSIEGRQPRQLQWQPGHPTVLVVTSCSQATSRIWSAVSCIEPQA